jgi:hypothetical protein
MERGVKQYVADESIIWFAEYNRSHVDAGS